jgi:hypothetical protein
MHVVPEANHIKIFAVISLMGPVLKTKIDGSGDQLR